MTQHDPLKAATEELSGMQDAYKVLETMGRAAERRLGEAEAELNALLKLRAILGEIIATQQRKLTALRTEAEARAKA